MSAPRLRVPQVDLTVQFQAIREPVMAAIEAALASGQLFLGPNTTAFEDEFAGYCGVEHAIGVANGTDALHLALRAAGIGPGDEVVTVSHTFIAEVEAIEQVGATPVLVDIDPVTYTMSPAAFEAAITPRTRAVVPVHLYGRLAEMDAITAIARRHQLLVIEDASQSQGAVDGRGRRAGSMGDVCCFSFYYAKNLGAYGEAGAITTSDDAIAARVRSLRSHGEDTRYKHEVLGFNSRPDEIQSAVLRIKLQRLDAWNALRQQHAARYDELLGDLPLGRPELLRDGSHVYHQYVVRSNDRDGLRQRLTERGIGTGVHYPIPIHLQPACRGLGYAEGSLPETERAAREVLSLPMYPELPPGQLELVVKELATALSALPIGV